MIDPPPGWQVRPLGEIVEVLDHARVPVNAKERQSRLGPVPYYGATGQVGWIDEALFDEDLVLLGEDGVQFFDPAKPKAYMVSGPAWVNNHAHVLRVPSDVIHRRFLVHFLNQFDFRGYANGTTRLKLTQGAMRRIPIAFPGLDEQHRLLAVLEQHLSDLDAAQAQLATAGARLGMLREAWLSARMGTPPIAELHRIGDVLVESRGGWSRSRAHNVAASDGVPYLKMHNITRTGRLDLRQLVYVAATEPEIERYGVRSGDILFNSKNSGDLIGKTAVASEKVAGWLLNENIMRLRFHDRLIPQFVVLWFLGPILRRRLRQEASASTNVSAVYKHQLVNMPMWVPPKGQQEKLVVDFEQFDQSLDALTAGIAAAEKRAGGLRRSLLNTALRGQPVHRSTAVANAPESHLA